MNQIKTPLLPVEIVFHSSWWNKHTGITFDEDFFIIPFAVLKMNGAWKKNFMNVSGNLGLEMIKTKICRRSELFILLLGTCFRKPSK